MKEFDTREEAEKAGYIGINALREYVKTHPQYKVYLHEFGSYYFELVTNGDPMKNGGVRTIARSEAVWINELKAIFPPKGREDKGAYINAIKIPTHLN